MSAAASSPVVMICLAFWLLSFFLFVFALICLFSTFCFLGVHPLPRCVSILPQARGIFFCSLFKIAICIIFRSIRFVAFALYPCFFFCLLFSSLSICLGYGRSYVMPVESITYFVCVLHNQPSFCPSTSSTHNFRAYSSS